MSTFWRPVAEGRVAETSPHKKLGNGLYEMWCRCDLCNGSGPMPNYVLAHKGMIAAEFCRECVADEKTAADLVAAGWVWL